MTETVIMNSDDIRRSLARIAHEIVERNKSAGNLVLVGMRTRGVPLAHRLADRMEILEKLNIPVGALDISFFRDDINDLSPQPTVQHTDIPVSVDGKTVILVDDVFY